MTSPEKLIGLQADDPRFVDFWGEPCSAVHHIAIDEKHTLSRPSSGISVSINDAFLIESISMFSGEDLVGGTKYCRYEGPIPEKLQFGMKIADAIALLGHPNEINQENSMFMGVKICPWFKYIRSNYALNVTADEKGDVVRGVSVMIKVI